MINNCISGEILLNQHDINGNIASNGNSLDWYTDTLHLTYFLGDRYYGFSKKNITNNDLKADFKKYSIDYYFVWGKSNNEALLSQYTQVKNGNIPNLRIYAVNGGK